MNLEPNTMVTHREYRGDTEMPNTSLGIGWVEHLDMLAYGYQHLMRQENFDITMTITGAGYVMIGIMPRGN